MAKRIPNFDEYPVSVTLRFKSEDAKEEFLGGLSDGFGENYCQLDCDWNKVKRSLTEASVLTVEVFGPPEDE